MINDYKIINEGKPRPGHYNPTYKLQDKRLLVANLNRDKRPKEELKLRDKTPHSNIYKVDLMNDRKVLSNRPRSIAYKWGDREVMRNKKIDSHFVVHEKSK